MSYIYALKSLISLITFIHKGKMRISFSKEDQTLSGEEKGIVEIGQMKLEIDKKGNLSIYSPSSISLKSKLIFLVANKDPFYMDKEIIEIAARDKDVVDLDIDDKYKVNIEELTLIQ